MITTQENAKLIDRAEWDVVDFEQKEVNARRHNRATHGDWACHFCNRTISDKALPKAWFVHMTVDGQLVRADVPDAEVSSQGWFPIGSDCAKKISIAYRKKLTPAE